MVKHYFRINFLTAMIVLLTVSSGCAATYDINQNILTKSNIKKENFKKKIFKRIKKSLQKEEKTCSIIVTDVAFRHRKSKGHNEAEEWTVDVCQETKIYFIIDESPYGGDYTVELKEARKARERKLWKSDKKFGGNLWSDSLFYLDEFEASDQGNENEDTEVKYIEYTIDGVPHKHAIEVKKKEATTSTKKGPPFQNK